MEFELNFKPDVETLNKRIYPKDVLLSAFEDAVARKVPFLFRMPESPSIHVADIMGFMSGYREVDNTIYITVEVTTPAKQVLEAMELEFKKNGLKMGYVTTGGTGNIKDGVIENFKINSVVAVNPEPLERK
jgi:hypothetical protein